MDTSIDFDDLPFADAFRCRNEDCGSTLIEEEYVSSYYYYLGRKIDGAYVKYTCLVCGFSWSE